MTPPPIIKSVFGIFLKLSISSLVIRISESTSHEAGTADREPVASRIYFDFIESEDSPLTLMLLSFNTSASPCIRSIFFFGD